MSWILLASLFLDCWLLLLSLLLSGCATTPRSQPGAWFRCERGYLELSSSSTGPWYRLGVLGNMDVPVQCDQR